MRKEVLVAILIGIILGGLVAFGIWRANLAFLPQKEETKTEQTASPTSKPDASLSSLIITQPENGSVIPESKVIIKGAAAPNSTVVILTESNDFVTQADKDGGFEQEAELEGGPNEITVTAYDDSGNETTQTLTLVYSTEFEKE